MSSQMIWLLPNIVTVDTGDMASSAVTMDMVLDLAGEVTIVAIGPETKSGFSSLLDKPIYYLWVGDKRDKALLSESGKL